MNLFTNDEKNDKMKKEEYLTADKSNSSTPTGISRFLYQTPEKQKNTVSQNNYYYPVNNSLQTKPFTVAPKADDTRTVASYNRLNEKSEESNIYKTSDNLYKKTPEIKSYSNNANALKNDRAYDNDYGMYGENPKNSYPKATVKKENYNDMKVKPEKSYSNTDAAKYLSESFAEYLKQNQKRRDANLKALKDSIYSLQKKNKTTSNSQTRNATFKDIYNPETLIASHENLRSDVSLYGKSPVDMNKTYSYENGELKVTMDNDYPLIAKSDKFKQDNKINDLLSETTKELAEYFKGESNKIQYVKPGELQKHLDGYLYDPMLFKDTTQYAIYKLIRAINNQKLAPSRKNMEVVDLMTSIIKRITTNTVAPEHIRTINSALNSTTSEEIEKGYTNVVKAWFDVYNYLSESRYADGRREDAIKDTSVNGSIIDYSINTIIDGFNQGQDNVKITLPYSEGTEQIIYDTSAKNKAFTINFKYNYNDIGTESSAGEEHYDAFTKGLKPEI